MEEATNPTTKRDLPLISCAHGWLAFAWRLVWRLGHHIRLTENDLKIGSDWIIWICDWYLSTLAWQKHHIWQIFSRHTKTGVFL